MSRTDPIRANYYSSVETFEFISDCLFYIGALLSLASLYIDKSTPILFKWVLIIFALTVFALFIVGMTLRLYLTPRAEDSRRQDFFRSAYGVNLTHLQTNGYYNNGLNEPVKRIAAQVFENSHFSKAIALRMAKRERFKISVYAIAWITCLINRESDIGIVIAASQAVFSEQVLSKFVRIEWLRMRFERTYDTMYNVFQTKPSKATFDAITLDTLSMYETAKSNAAITLSSKIFDEMNVSLSNEWSQIKSSLNI